jgi:hypothetical protein
MFALVLLLPAFIGCEKGIDVVITGTISGYRPSDRVIVALSENWQYAYRTPRKFEIDDNGNFVIEFTLRRTLRPVSIVKNDRLHAKLIFDDLHADRPVVVDHVSGRAYNIDTSEDFVFRVDLKL